jgi:prepilin peptidase CpaA
MTMADPIAFALLMVVLLVAATSDVRTGLIANRLTLSAMALGLIYWTFWGLAADGLEGAMTKFGESGIALATGLVPFVFLYLFAGALGGGDAKLMGAVGALSADWRMTVETALLAFVFAAVFAVALMVRHGIVMRTLRRVFAAAMSVAARVRPSVDDEAPRVPFGAAIACGAVLAGMKFMLDIDLPLANWGM